MKTRIVSIICAISVVVTMFAIGIVSVSADVNITDGLNATDWTGDTANIYELQAGGYGFLSSGGNKAVKTITSVASYDLGSNWKASFKIRSTYSNNMYGQPYVLKIGTLEAVVYNAVGSGSGITTNAAIELKKDSASVEKLDLENVGTASALRPDNIDGILELSYNNGVATVTYDGTAYITENVGAIDFTDVKATLSIMGNYSNKAVGIQNFVLKSELPVSSAPASSEPASSESASDASDSSTPDSSEPTSSAAPAGEKVVAEISGALVAEMWQESDKITDGVAIIPKGSDVTLNSVKKYDLGTEWETAAEFQVTGWYDQMNHRPVSITLGDVEIVSTDGKYSGGEVSEDGSIELKIKGNTVQTYPVTYTKTNSAALSLRATYKDGIIKVYYSLYGADEVNIITYDATADELDFSETAIALYHKADWAINNKIKTFNLKTADTYVEPGAAIETVTDGSFNTTDWVGDVSAIRADDSALQTTGNGKVTITTAKSYDLSEGFKFSSKLVFKNSHTNYYGEYASIYVGEPKDGLEVRIANVKGQGLYTGHIFLKGAEIATTDLVNAPNGVYEITYKDGKLIVTLDGTAINWSLADKSTSTSVGITDVELSKTTLGLHIEGNYNNTHRHWIGYNLSAVTGVNDDVPGTTGDVRNVAIITVVLVMSACAVAFVATRKRANV